MKKTPFSSARVIGLSQKHFASTAGASKLIQETLRGVSQEGLRQCRGGVPIVSE
jgi:hypothetical protein